MALRKMAIEPRPENLSVDFNLWPNNHRPYLILRFVPFFLAGKIRLG